MKHRKMFGGLFLLVCALVVAFVVQLDDLLDRPPSTSSISPSGRYRVQSVSTAGLFFTYGGMSYLQITDRRDPQRVYRTPLIDDQLLDLRLTEDGESLSIFGLEFRTASKTYIIALPQWEHHWLNVFISNTPYEFCGDTDGNCL